MLAGDYVRRGVAEFVGTFALIFVGAGAVVYGDLVGIALANGLAIAVMVSAVGFISGGLFNPAITLAFLVTRRISGALAVWYWLIQFSAAALAAVLLRWVLPGQAQTPAHLGAPSLNHVSAGQGLVIEAVLTFFLVWVVFATAVDERGAFKQIAGLAIGLTITLDALMGLGLTGAAMNPARALGPMLANAHWNNWWVWFVGPGAGAVIAGSLYEWLYLRPTPTSSVGSAETAVAEAASGTAALD